MKKVKSPLTKEEAKLILFMSENMNRYNKLMKKFAKFVQACSKHA